MLIVLSPAKNLDYETPTPTKKHTKNAFLKEAEVLVTQLKGLAPQDLSKLMGISDKLALLNYDRYQSWQQPFKTGNARQAMFAFKGDVYVGLDAYQFGEADIEFAQNHVRILSGLYGLLKPLDLILPYRLEMGTKFENDVGKDLYAFWDNKITVAINKQMKKLDDTTLVNLASNEYFNSVKKDQLNGEIITPIFKDWKNGQYKMISFFAKKARGLMSAYIIKNKISEVADIKRFNVDGYKYNKSLSTDNQWVFTRKQ